MMISVIRCKPGILLALSLCLIGSNLTAAPNPPLLLAYQGLIVDADGTVLAAGTTENHDVIFRIYNASQGGDLLWSEQQTVIVDNGTFSVTLGNGSEVSGEPRPSFDQVFQGTDVSDRYIGISVSGLGGEIAPRLRFLSSPFTFLAQNAIQLVGSSGGQGVTVVDGAIRTTGGDARGAAAVDLQTQRDAGDQVASGSQSFLGSGENNKVTGLNAAVVGGNGNAATAENAVIAGGREQLATAVGSSVGGGFQNQATGENARVGGGASNGASATGSNVSGGRANLASGLESTVAGGAENRAESQAASIGGGKENVVTGNYGVVAGGEENLANGTAATVPGGLRNRAEGVRSFAAGTRAQAVHDGAFVWADSSEADFASQAPNQFRVRSAGGAYFEAPTLSLQNAAQSSAVWGLGAIRESVTVNLPFVGPITTTSDRLEVRRDGARMAFIENGDGWMTDSDRRLKRNIVGVDGVLDDIEQIDLVRFNWKDSESKGASRRIGVVAQDVQSVFPELVSDTGETLGVNYSGLGAVAVEAVKELRHEGREEMEALRAENQLLRENLEALMRRVESLEARAGD